MCRLWLPEAFGSSSSIDPCTLVASTMASRLPFRFSALPTASSLAPVLYTFAVSRKLTPPSMARSIISAESSSFVLPPNIMHPRQISLTFTPVLPRFLYSTIRSFEVVVAFFNIPRQRQRNFRGLIPRFRVCSIAACGSGLVRQRRKGRAHVVRNIRWGILGTGAIARRFVRGLRSLPKAEVFAVGSRSEASAAKFADEHNIPRRHASYEDLASDPGVDVIYIATPHPLHAENATLCLQAGKA